MKKQEFNFYNKKIMLGKDAGEVKAKILHYINGYTYNYYYIK